MIPPNIAIFLALHDLPGIAKPGLRRYQAIF